MSDTLRVLPAATGLTERSRRAVALECLGLSKDYGQVSAVHDLDITVLRGQVLALLGPSGCGKTTALRLISGFDVPKLGTITIGRQVVFGPGRFVPPEKRRVGMVFQEGALFPHLTVAQNIAYGIPSGDGRSQRIQEVLRLVGLDGMGQRMPYELSGGQQQRVALARALAPSPEVLLLDEPFSNLDPGLREQVRGDVLKILRDGNVTAVFVTHDQEEAMYVGDIIAVMNQGRVEQVGTPEVIFHSPASRFVAQFIGMVDFIPASQHAGRLTTEVGSVDWDDPIPADGELEVMVRPDCLECRPSAQGQGIILDREFRGAFYLYRVGLPSGHTIRCLLSHTEEFSQGTKVDVTLREGHALRPFVEGHPIGLDSAGIGGGGSHRH